jgi:imidazolonepropionase-like amidohydrolase
MRSLARVVLATVASLFLAGCGVGSQAPAIDADLAIVDVTVVPMTGESVLEGRTVLVKDGRIVAVEPTGKITVDEDARVVDGAGKFLTPALADMHVHIWSESDLLPYVANGVTLVRNMWGEPSTLAMRDRISKGEILGPRIVTSGKLVDGDPPIWGDASGVATTAEEAVALMDEQKVGGYDFFKIYNRLEPEVFEAIAAHSKEIDFPFGGHVPSAVPLDHALRSGMSSIEHLAGWDAATRVPGGGYATYEEASGSAASRAGMVRLSRRLRAGEIGWEEVFDPERRAELAALAAETGIWNVPTSVVNKHISTSRRQAEAEFARPEMRYISPSIRAMWNPDTDFRLKELSDDDLEAMQIFFEPKLATVNALRDAGARLLAGTDAPNPFVLHGFSLHEELAFFVEAGLSPYEALLAATRAPAEFLGEADEFGTVESGKRADLLLVDADPLEDVGAMKRIAGVVLAGRWLPRVELDAALEALARSFELPADWFEGLEPLPDDGEKASYEIAYNDSEVGAERFANVRADDGSYRVVGQARIQFGDLITQTVRVEAGAGGAFERLVFRQEAPSGTIEGEAVASDGRLTLRVASTEGDSAIEVIELGEKVIVTCDLTACRNPIVSRLAELEPGEKVEFDVRTRVTFGGLHFEPETWTAVRRPDREGARVYALDIRRSTETSELRVGLDDSGWRYSRLSDQMGVTEVARVDP